MTFVNLMIIDTGRIVASIFEVFLITTSVNIEH